MRELAKHYYSLKYGELIEKPNELLRVAIVKSTKHAKHPHDNFRVYLSRRALKHIVETRKLELSKNHKEAEVLMKICLTIEQIPNILMNFDKYEYEHEPEKYFYTKHYPGEPSIRILCERSKEPVTTLALEICSIHFTKPRRETQK